MACSTTRSQCFSNLREARMVLAKAMARARGRVLSLSACPDRRPWSARQHPNIFAASVMLISLPLLSAKCARSVPSTPSSATAKMTTW